MCAHAIIRRLASLDIPNNRNNHRNGSPEAPMNRNGRRIGRSPEAPMNRNGRRIGSPEGPMNRNGRRIGSPEGPKNRNGHRIGSPEGLKNRNMLVNPAANGQIYPNVQPNLYGNAVANPYAAMNINHMMDPRINQRYGQVNQIQEAQPARDLRFIMFRHAERLDHSLGQNWYQQIFGDKPVASSDAYRNPHLPKRLPHRNPTLIYEFDPPISSNGQIAAKTKGQHLLNCGAKIDYCFSSPASRCVLTADALLHGLNQIKVPIRIEPHLFEPMSWNSPLRLLGDQEPFLTAAEWRKAGFNTDTKYKSYSDHIPVYGSEHDYYDRSKWFFDQTVKLYDTNLLPPTRSHIDKRHVTILIIGHAATTETMANIALGTKFDVTSLFEQCKSIPYLHSAIMERNPNTRSWGILPTISAKKELND